MAVPESTTSPSYLANNPFTLSTSSPHNTRTPSPLEGVNNSLRTQIYPNSMLNNSVSSTGSLGRRTGAGSPSNYETGGKLFSKRAREIQAEEGVGPSLWGPLNSTGNTIREREPTIQESPTSPYGEATPLPNLSSPSTNTRRARAGTLPSRLPPGGLVAQQVPPMPSTSRPTPSVSPFKAPSVMNGVDTTPISIPTGTASAAARLRSGSLNLPPRANYVNPFGPSIFNTPWATTVRERNASASSTNGPTSPAQSSFSKEDDHAGPMRTLDYLGLADPPSNRLLQSSRQFDPILEGQRAAALQPLLGDMSTLHRSLNRLRSYSVNAKEKYEEDEDEELVAQRYDGRNGNLTPNAGLSAAVLAQAQAQAANLAAVAAYTNNLIVNRPRARTAGILETPPPRSLKNYLTTPSRLGDAMSASDLRMTEREYFDAQMEAMQQMNNPMIPRPSSGNDALLLSSVDEGGLEGPTRALWLGNIPASTTTSSLVAIFQTYGPIESARVLTHKNCGFVNFERIESAIQSRQVFNGKEIFPGAGPVRIGFAKVPTTPGSGTPGVSGGLSPTPDVNTPGAVSSMQARGATPVNNNIEESADSAANAALTVPDLAHLKTDMVQIVQDFGANAEEAAGIGKNIDFAAVYDSFEEEIPTIPEPSHNRVHDAPKLREIRKRIDNNACSQDEIEEIALGMLDEIAELSSDYLGNTVVQKLFEYCSEDVKMKMLERVAPHLAEIGVHKNGTWAGQKIIDVAKNPEQKNKICESLRPYTVALFLDQYGNYVLQCCLRFGAPFNDFIFETMLGRMWEIAQGRFGARAMRACLESHHANKDQQRMMAAAIALHSVQLATNANGALLLTWFLDTCTFPNRRTVLAPRLVPHLIHLCTHKVAYLTVLKVINQRNEKDARDVILKALFFSPQDKTLEAILADHSCGATLIFKVLTTPFFDEKMRNEVVQNVKNVLIKLKAHPSQGYKRLMDEVGLPTRSGGNSKEHSREGRRTSTQSPNRGATERQKSRDHHSSANSQHGSAHQTSPRDYNPGNQPFNQYDIASVNAYATTLAAQQLRNGMMNPDVAQAMEQLNLYGQPQLQQQYQAAALYAANGIQPPYYPNLPYMGQMPPLDQFRGSGQLGANGMGGQGLAVSPILGMPQPFNPLMVPGLAGGYGYPGMNGIPNMPNMANYGQHNQNGNGNSGSGGAGQNSQGGQNGNNRRGR